MDATSLPPVPVLSSTVDVPPLRHIAESNNDHHGSSSGMATLPQSNMRAEENTTLTPAAATAVVPTATPSLASRPFDAFTVRDASADPLLAGLHLAQAQLAARLGDSTDNSFYHGGAVTSLLAPTGPSSSSPPLSPPLRRDVVDAAEAADAQALAMSSAAAGGATVQASAEVQHDGGHRGSKKKRKHGGGEKEGKHAAHKKQQPRHRSRRQREHDMRIEAALNPAFVCEMRERVAVPVRQSSKDQDVVVVLDSSRSSSSSSSNSTSSGDATAAPRDPRKPTGSSEPPEKEEATANKKRPGGKAHQRRRSRHASAHRPPATTDLEAHVRHLPPADNDAVAAEIDDAARQRQREEQPPEAHAGAEDYSPDDDDATAILNERVRLLQGGGAHGDEIEVLRGYAALVRPADHFQRSPAPSWMLRYSNWLLFDAHTLDSSDAAMLDSLQRDTVMGGTVGASVQLPVDAVVLRLRGDIARARRLRDAIVKGGGAVHRLFFRPDTDVARCEVYNPAELNWDPCPPAAAAAAQGQALANGAEGEMGEVEVQAAIPPKTAELQPNPSGLASIADRPPSDSGTATVVVVADEQTTAPAKVAPVPQYTPLLLSRSLEVKDLARPLQAQTIPPWRRRGAAVKFLTELIQFLEGRLQAFGKQLDDPVQGPALELIGAPDSSGVDGSVRSTHPPALERALRTTITNTLLSDLFATSRTALGSRALRISEALRRRQTPYVHDVYVTQLDCRPLYDYTTLLSSRSVMRRYTSTPGGGVDGHPRGHATTSAAVTGVDTRQSYSIHVDYVRFQPSLESSAISVLRRGHLGHSHKNSAADAADSGEHGPLAGSSRRHSTAMSSSEEAFSSVLLGSYMSVFFPTDKAATTAGHNNNFAHTVGPNAGGASDGNRRGSLGTDDVNGTTAALLLALSTATSHNTLIPFSPEEYLISLLLRYYEQYRMLQLNLLPSLKNRFFYQEQLAQLQRQTRRTTELTKLQSRLEQLVETSANVERGCLHVMVLLWSAVLEERRRRRRFPPRQVSSAAGGGSLNSPVMDKEEEEEDVPIVIGSRSAARSNGDRHRKRSGSHCDKDQSNANTTQVRGEPRADLPLPLTPEEVRAHPPLFAAAGEQAGATPMPVVHSVNNTVTYMENVSDDVDNAAAVAASGDRPSSLPLFLSPDARGASASASPLLAPPSVVSSTPTTSSRPTDLTNNLMSPGEDGRVVGQDVGTSLPATRFRFFLRRYGTTEEAPYRMGDDLLHYAAEVEGTDVILSTKAAAAATQEPASTERHHRNSSTASPSATHVDEVLYFQLVVFTRSHAAIAPQYVGCTAPRPLTTAKVIFFNETFEVRALHEPAELLLHLIPVTTGPAKLTVVSTVRLRPTLTRCYSLLPLQPPTAFMFHGKLFTRNRTDNSGSGSSGGASPFGAASTLSAAPISGVLAVSTTWTSSQGLTIGQMEKMFLRGSGGADPLDPQYLPLLRALRSYYTEVGAARATSRADAASEQERARAKNRGRRDRRGAAIRDSRGHSANTAGHESSNASHHHARSGSSPQLGRHASTVALLRQRNASASLQRQLTTLGPSALFNAAAATRSSFRVLSTAETGGGVSGAAGGGGGNGGNSGSGPGALNQPSYLTPKMVLAAASGGQDYAVEEVLQRLPTTRLQYLFRRWLIKIGRVKPADEVESRLLGQPIPLDDADTYLARKRVLRVVEREEDVRSREYSASGAQFDAERYYKAPSAISGLALSNLPRETKLKLWRERQRRLLLTLKANRHVSDAEKLEMIVKVPKLVTKLVFDFAPRSQLNPHRQVRPKTEDIDRAVLKRRQDSRIVIHIMKAHNLPHRADGTPLEPFVQATFVSEAAYTRSEVGSSPSWFQTLELPFQPLDFEEDTLSMIDDDVVIALYDKVEVKMAPAAATTAAVAHETHYRTERRFIGTLRIPFYSLHQANEARMEGVYPLRTPRWLLGYNLAQSTADIDHPYNWSTAGGGGGAAATGLSAWTNKPDGHDNGNCGNDGGDGDAMAGPLKGNPLGAVDCGLGGGAGGLSASPSSAAAAVVAASSGVQEQQTNEPTVQLYLSLWPPLQRDPPKKLSSAELQRSVGELFVPPPLQYLHRVALQWQHTALKRAKSIAAMNAQATTRQIDPFVECSTGDLVLVCRYMLPRGGPPPPSVRTVFEAIRYVSLLPFVADMMSFGEKDVWSTNAELLAMRSGDYEELALLLVHFLRYLAPGRPTYAVVGSGSIYQQTIMVLHQFEDAELYLIDPRSGWTVPAGRPYGTLLRDVYMVVSHDQMWANTQISGLPHRMTWDLHNPTHWLPCFDGVKDRRIPACLSHLHPIQREVLDFPPADAVKSREIEMELRSCLKRALLTWRNGCPPSYHRGVEAILREVLEAAEEERCTCGSARRTDITASAAARLSEYFGVSVTGDPMPRQESFGAEGRSEKGRRGRRHHSRRRPHHDGEDGEKGHGKNKASDDEDSDGADLRREVGAYAAAPSLSSSSAIRVLGAPVMGSYNPSDPQFEELLQQVFEGAVHEVGSNDVSFAAGIYVKSFTGDVCAMWVFLVAICRG